MDAEVPQCSDDYGNPKQHTNRPQTHVPLRQIPNYIKPEPHINGSTHHVPPSPPKSPATPRELASRYTAESPNLRGPRPTFKGISVAHGKESQRKNPARPKLKMPGDGYTTNSTSRQASTLLPSSAGPKLKMPPGLTAPQQQLASEPLTPNRSDAHATSSRMAARRSKAERILQAWQTFNDELLDVDQEPDEEEDDDIYAVLSYMVRISRDYLHGKGVKRLLDLAEEV
ncbi:hypothetical protein BJ170DRAFT_635806, partial [Xylariales sp. AK1849]